MSTGPGAFLVVSIHDVAPATLARCREIVQALDGWGVGPLTLLVVPDYHGQGPLCDDPETVRWLGQRAARGDEIVLHGFRHERARKESDGTGMRVVTEFYTAGEGEFFDATREQSDEWISRGERIFERAGLGRPTGFVAPAWLYSEETFLALRQRAYRHAAWLGGLKDLSRGTLISSKACVWSVRAAWRRATSIGWNTGLSFVQRTNPLFRVEIHPVDFDFPPIAQQIERIVKKSLKDRKGVTTAQVVDLPPEKFSD